jgi:uncharacterized protein with PQ loop repeat
MNVVDVFGFASSILITLMFVPEIVHVYKNQDAKAINYSFLHLNLLASAFALVYSIYYKVIPMTITNVAAGLFSLVMYHFKYTKEVKEKESNTNEVGI